MMFSSVVGNGNEFHGCNCCTVVDSGGGVPTYLQVKCCGRMSLVLSLLRLCFK